MLARGAGDIATGIDHRYPIPEQAWVVTGVVLEAFLGGALKRGGEQ